MSRAEEQAPELRRNPTRGRFTTQSGHGLSTVPAGAVVALRSTCSPHSLNAIFFGGLRGQHSNPGERVASTRSGAPGSWWQAEGKTSQHGGGNGGQRSGPCRFSSRRTNASSSQSSDEHPQACLLLLIGGGGSRRAGTFWGGQDVPAARRCGS